MKRFLLVSFWGPFHAIVKYVSLQGIAQRHSENHIWLADDHFRAFYLRRFCYSVCSTYYAVFSLWLDLAIALKKNEYESELKEGFEDLQGELLFFLLTKT